MVDMSPRQFTRGPAKVNTVLVSEIAMKSLQETINQPSDQVAPICPISLTHEYLWVKNGMHIFNNWLFVH